LRRDSRLTGRGQRLLGRARRRRPRPHRERCSRPRSRGPHDQRLADPRALRLPQRHRQGRRHHRRLPAARHRSGPARRDADRAGQRRPRQLRRLHVTIDGKPVTPTLQRQAWFKGQDITDELLAKNLKLSFFEPGFYDALWALPKPERQALHARELVFFEEDYHNLYAQWLLRTAFHWQQVFPAGKTVIVEHSYKPVVGQFFVSKWSLPGAEQEAGEADELAAYCLDEGTTRAIRKRIKARSTTAEEEGLLIARAVDYILTTANNWRGPIGKFRLTLDKEDTKRLLSVCLDGLEKTAPTTFTAEFENYVPASDLHVLILE
jgi:Domain of unknown function (DUF4424)